MRRQFTRRWTLRLDKRRREELLLALLALACLALAWIFAKLASEVLEGDLLALDRATQRFIALHRSPMAARFFGIVTHLGAKEVLAPISALVGWRLLRGSRAVIALLAFCALAAGEFVAVLKRDFHIARPTGGIAEGLGYSFPSGHSTGSMAMAVVIGYVAFRRRMRPAVVIPSVALLPLLVGMSRVYLDLHWASDVLGGWLVGAAFGVGCCAVFEIMHRRGMTAGEAARPGDARRATVAAPEP